MIAGDQGRAGSRVGTRQPRICLPTARQFSRMAFQCGHLEAQDVLAECEDVDLVCLEAEPGLSRKLRWLRRLLYRDVSGRLAYVNPGLKRVRLAKDYDVLVVMCQGYWEFLYVNALDSWKDRCRTSVCWIDELYASDIPRFKHWLPSLRRFDHVVVGMHGTVAALSEALGRRCHYVPGAVDTLRFSPYPSHPDRVLDVYSVGRRLETIHKALLDLVDRDRIFYAYDTIQTGVSQAPDHREHRELYANTAKRSRFFVVAPSKVDVPDETDGQVEVGFRYYEGVAAGTVMVGQAPDCRPFREMFDWPDVVVHLRPDGSDVKEILRGLVSEQARLREVGERNAREALLRHDWIHRWRRVLEIAGLQVGPGTERRETTLKALAQPAGLGVSE
jgi:spore maturation protein CgeB